MLHTSLQQSKSFYQQGFPAQWAVPILYMQHMQVMNAKSATAYLMAASTRLMCSSTQLRS